LLVPAHIAPDIRRPYASTILGFLVMSIQLLSGVAGVLVDIFFFRTDLDRRQIVATKAFSQLVGHVYRLIYFTLIATHSEVSSEVPLWVFGVSIVTAMAGATLARVVLDRLTNRAFLMWTRGLGVAVGAVYLVHGIYLLLYPG
jgi:uncharacterized membrane protein YfcA